MNKFWRWILVVTATILLCACGGAEEPTLLPSLTQEMPAPLVTVESGDGQVIAGEEALELYGIGGSPTPAPATATPQIWFPAKAWVEPSTLPYDPNETINFLPMYTKTDLGEVKTYTAVWLGDLEAGQEVILHGITQDGLVCLVEGITIQGWEAKGWVACNRLRFTEPNG